ncbi:MAG: hypothetical protein JNL74_05945 [Fibrobacteres bacterium]|nr:hypothetical protein [Fibrobacterota bacterium]
MVSNILITFAILISSALIGAVDNNLYDIRGAEKAIGLSKSALIDNGYKLLPLKWHVFRGITLFGCETLQVYQVIRKNNQGCRELVAFRNDRVVSVEARFEASAIDLKDQILKPALVYYGVRNCVKHFHVTQNFKVNGWLLKGKKSIAVVTNGSFKDNLAPGWTKLRVFDAKFFHFRNQHTFWPNDYGPERLILR